MILSPEELQWVTERMKIYDIKYQEIYYEILDHILTAIEAKRDSGDKRDISVVFQDVVDADFGGYSGIENLALEQGKSYRKYVGSTFQKYSAVIYPTGGSGRSHSLCRHSHTNCRILR